MPQFSVVIACYNAAHTLPEALASLQSQTHANWEAICIDDGSTDGTLGLLKAAAADDVRIKIIAQANAGPSVARNAGVDAATGDWIAFLDADDLWLPHKLDVVADVVAHEPDVAAVFGKIAFFEDASERDKTVSTVQPGQTPLERILGENPVCTLSNLCVKREAFHAVHGFDVTMRYSEDLDFIIRLVTAGFPLIGTDTLLMRYRASNDGLSANLMQMHDGWRLAIASAGASVTPQQRACAEALHLRYLARRALRLDQPGLIAAAIALQGLKKAPLTFLSDRHRGAATLICSFVAPLIPTALRRKLFA